MNVYPHDIERKLEVDQVRELIKKECQTISAEKYVIQARPLNKHDKLSVTLAQTSECIQIFSRGEDKPLGDFEDLSVYFKKLETSGTYLFGEDFAVIKSGLKTMIVWLQYLKKYKEHFPKLYDLTLGYVVDNELVKDIDQIIDEKGEIKNNASSELIYIRSTIVKAEQKVRKSIKSILERSKKDKYSDDDSEVTIREGRLVIPVKSEFKRNIAGFVHDESSTGQTVYMEPSQVLALNNEVKELHYQEKREIERILTALSEKIRYQLEDLKKGAGFMVLLDFISAKAKFALKNEAIIPKSSKTPGIKLEVAFHPLLKKLNSEQKKPTVPLSIELNHTNQRMAVISGPNAGGKSVAMKTVGIIQYLFQCGFPVPVGESSELGVFSQIFIDIGDSQSLENDLSTYSSRLKAMKYFTDMADKRSLVLMDEFGSGTEPQFGGALAEAILKELGSLKCYGVVTTHYANIKKFAEENNGMINAAMRYDTDKLEPLFQLDMGRPGSSFALEIAKKTGVNQQLLSYAKKQIGSSHVEFERLLSEIENDKVKLNQKLVDVKRKEREVQDLRKDYESLKSMLESEKKATIKKAKQEAAAIISNANKEVERTIRHIKESKADKEKTKVARERLQRRKMELGAPKNSMEKKTLTSFEIGDWVKIEGQEGVGQISRINKKQAQVTLGSLKSFISIDRLEKVSKSVARKQVRRTVAGIDMNDKMTQFSSELDVRGKRAEETLPVLEEWLDQALLLGMHELKVIHGKGHGILRELIRTELKNHPSVANFEDEHEDRGGAGTTIVYLN